MLILHKILPALILPIGLVLILLGLAYRFQRRVLLVAAAGFLLAVSLPLFSQPLCGWWESRFPFTEPNRLPESDAVVVLSGIVVQRGSQGFYWNEGVNRFDVGCQIWRHGRTQRIILMNDLNSQAGRWLRNEAESRGIPANRISVLGPVRNTMEEARLLRVFGEKNGLRSLALVTSGFHMRRAMYAFSIQGLHPFPVPADSRVSSPSRISPADFFPAASALQDTETVFRELLGMAFYALYFLIGPPGDGDGNVQPL